jgi:signal transduction histidine kinase
MAFNLSRARAIFGKLIEHPVVERLRRWWAPRDFTLLMGIGGFILLILTVAAIVDFIRVAKNKDEIHQASILRSQLGDFLLATRVPDGSSLLENPAENSLALRPVRVMTLRRPFFSYLLTKGNLRSFQTDEIRFELPRNCAVEFPVDLPAGAATSVGGTQSAMQACMGAIPRDPAGRYVYFALRYPSPPVTRHSPGQSLAEGDRVILQFSGQRTVKLTLTFEPVSATNLRRSALPKKFDGFHEIAGFLTTDGGRPTRSVQGQAYERAHTSGIRTVTILGRIDGAILPGFDDSEVWPSGGIKALRIGAEIVLAEERKSYGFSPGAIGKAIMSLEQAYVSSVPSRATLMVGKGGSSDSEQDIWNSTSLDVGRASPPPALWQSVSNHIAGLIVAGAKSVRVTLQQDIEGMPRMTSTLTADGIVIPDIAARAFAWMVALLLVLIALISVAWSRLAKLGRLTRTAHAIAKAHRLGSLAPYARDKDQIGTLGRVMNVLLQRDQKRIGRYFRRLENELREQQEAVTNDRELLQIRQYNLRAIGHGIKSPLGTLLASKDLSEKHRRELEGMRRIVEALYEANRLEEGLKNGLLVLSTEDIAAYVAAFAKGLTDEGQPVVARVPEKGIMAIYDEIILGQHLDHVVRNAFRYATSGTDVEVSVREERGTAVIEIFNFGKHIEDTVEIFSLGVSDSASPESMGLGLYAAKLQICGMNGNIHAENRDGGVAFVITLPTP